MSVAHVQERSPFELLQWLERRGKESALDLPQQVVVQPTWTGLGFRLAEHRLASPFGEVVEVLRTPSMTRVPRAKHWVLGLANVRGRLLPIVDLRRYFGLPAQHQPQERTLLIEQHDVAVGLVVDEVLGVRHLLPDERTVLPPETFGALARYVHDGFRQEGMEWGIFSFHDLLETPEFMQVAA